MLRSKELIDGRLSPRTRGLSRFCTLCGVFGLLTVCLGLQCPVNCEDDTTCTEALPFCGPDGVCVECVDDADCDDADACNGDETCSDNLVCVEGTALNCDDDDECTTDTCVPATGCSNVATNCNDGLFCNGVETCDAATGDCVDAADPCVAGQTCIETSDTCADQCTSSAQCNDNDACTVDTCTENICLRTAVSCNDDDLCTTDTCTPATGCANAPVTCPAGQTCDPATGACTSGCVSNTDCNDNNQCTNDSCTNGSCANDAVDCPQGERCNPANGNCEDIDCVTNADCDDGASCTTDTCQVSTGNCVYTHIDAACDDGLFCNGEEGAGSCDPDNNDAEALTGCVRPGNPCGGTTPVCNEAQDDCDACDSDSDCDDGFSCTNDNCENDGSCTNAEDDAECDDDLFCTDDDFCEPDHDDADPVTGCVNINDPCEVIFNVAGFFNAHRICNEGTDECDDCESNAQCSDGIACTRDTCDGATGICASESDDDLCSDPDFCDGVDFCNPNDEDADSNGCVRPGNPCDNNTPICDEAGNDCEACTSNSECDDWVGRDNIACTDTTCNGVTGACSNTANNANCPQGQVCDVELGCVVAP